MLEAFFSVFVLICILGAIWGTIKANNHMQKVTEQALKEIEQGQKAIQDLRDSTPEPDVVVTVDKDGNIWHSHIVDRLSTDPVVSILPGGKDTVKNRKPNDRRTMWD